MKRFTETDKWKNPAFRNLPHKFKLLYLYILDECDNAGVLHMDLERFSFVLKEEFTLEEIKTNIGDKLHFFKDKIAVIGFINFQCGQILSSSCHPHKKIMELLVKHGLKEKFDNGQI